MISFIHKNYSIFFFLCLVVISGLSFYLGYNYKEKGVVENLEKNENIILSCPNTILEKQRITPTTISTEKKVVPIDLTDGSTDNEQTPSQSSQGLFTGSKNGTKYYTPGCPGSKRIKPENIIWFQSVEDAIVQGYSKGSC